jgi:hypothetical protein
LLLGGYLVDEHGVESYSDSKNAVHGLRRSYDHALADRDALAIPTVPFIPFEGGVI